MPPPGSIPRRRSLSTGSRSDDPGRPTRSGSRSASGCLRELVRAARDRIAPERRRVAELLAEAEAAEERAADEREGAAASRAAAEEARREADARVE